MNRRKEAEEGYSNAIDKSEFSPNLRAFYFVSFIPKAHSKFLASFKKI